jgi:hypothetical protein
MMASAGRATASRTTEMTVPRAWVSERFVSSSSLLHQAGHRQRKPLADTFLPVTENQVLGFNQRLCTVWAAN